MGAIAFTRNYTDHSNDTGYQFEFHCDKCGNGFRSTFHASALGVGSKIAKGLGSLFGGGNLWAAGQAGEYMKDGLRGPQWDNAFKAAVEEIKPKFHQCTRCGIWVCPEVCWNAERGMCENCAPDLAEEAASAQAHIAADQAREKLRLREGQRDELRERFAGSRLERFIGVVYRPDTERWSHYADAELSRQFDAWVWFDTTRAVTALADGHAQGMPDTYPFGV